jgi:transposase
MKPYSEDLRTKIVEALHRGMNNSEAARTFGVSLSSVKRYAKMDRSGESLASKSLPANPSSSIRPRGSSWRPI